MCSAHAAVRSFVGEMISGHDSATVVDIEAGLEHLSRGTARHVDALLIVVEPYFKSMETAVRVHALAQEMGLAKIWAVANKVRSPADAEDLKAFLGQRGVEVVAVVPYDDEVLEAERRGSGPLDVSANGAAVKALSSLVARVRGEA